MKKLKDHYKFVKPCRPLGSPYTYFYRLRSLTFKQFSTKQERSYYYLHEIEYREYPLKLRKARGKLLPDNWDDFPTSIYRVAKSWKHNSRRAHQYYR
ncbi:hypothetical protein [Nissabacter sp. SGAir0207]|uniref:hypothetical protein n=1 Tax=Nissabacter sp. SGAir0207 TaxID=2126321 RepID=UPI0010CD298F|nr:hypothetical protein [Nissabacter sp. SGAir0207]QCR38171.1 hypothetical protein C1N62_18770 [Nissabacter sp. SGAir0207]